MTPLRQKMINDMKLRGFSPRIRQSHPEAVTGLAKYFNQSPDRLRKEQVQQYLLYLMEDKKLSWSSCNIAASAFRFLYGKTLEDETMRLSIPPRKKVKKLPEILSTQEVERLLEELRVYWTMYRPPLWLFPSSKDRNKPLNISTAQRIYYKSKEKAKITKGRGIHTLRHCFATHMLEAGQ